MKNGTQSTYWKLKKKILIGENRSSKIEKLLGEKNLIFFLSISQK